MVCSRVELLQTMEKKELVLEGEGRMHMADGEEEGSKMLLSGKA